MGTPIYLKNDSQDELTRTLLQIAVTRQQTDAQKETLKLRQQELKLRQEEDEANRQKDQQAQQAQQAQAAFLMQQLLQPQTQMIQQLAPTLASGFGGGGPPIEAPMLPAQQQFGQFANQNPALAPLAAPMAFKAFEAENLKRQEEATFMSGLDTAQKAGLLDSSELAGLVAYRRLSAGGGNTNPELKALIPRTAQEKVELSLKIEELRNVKSEQEADRIATEYAVQKGWIMPGGPIKGMAKQVFDEGSKVRSEARARSLELEKVRLANMDKVLENDAMEVAVGLGTTDPAAIAAGLRARLPAAEARLAMSAAVKASDGLRKMRAPANETQTKLRLAYAPAKAAHQTMVELTGKGVAWSAAMDQAVAKIKLPSWVGSAEQIEQLSRAGGRLVMSPEQKMFYLSALTMLEARLRPLTGAAIVAEETQRFFDSLPRGFDDMNTRAGKLAVQETYLEGLRQAAGIEEELTGPGIDAAKMLLRLRGPEREGDIQEVMKRTGASHEEAAKIVDRRKR